MLGASAILAFVERLLGSATGRALLLLAAFFAWTGYQRHDAAKSVRVEIRTRELEAYTAQVESLSRFAEAARARAVEGSEAARAMEAERNEIIAEYAGVEDGDCVIPDDVRERLLRIGQ